LNDPVVATALPVCVKIGAAGAFVVGAAAGMAHAC
jgi:hypothetical protein